MGVRNGEVKIRLLRVATCSAGELHPLLLLQEPYHGHDFLLNVQ